MRLFILLFGFFGGVFVAGLVSRPRFSVARSLTASSSGGDAASQITALSRKKIIIGPLLFFSR